MPHETSPGPSQHPTTDSAQSRAEQPRGSTPSGAQVGLAAVILAAFTGVLVISNVVAVKLIAFGPFIVDGGVFLFPLVYILGDVLAEVYGLKSARRAIFTGFALSLLATLTIFIVQISPPAADWPFQQAFDDVLGFVPRIVAASLAGYLAGQFVNAWVLVRLRDRARERRGPLGALWFRLLGSTVVGQLVDTIVFCTVAFYGVIEGWDFLGYTALGYAIKVLAEVILLPVTTRVIGWVRRTEGLGVEPVSGPAR